MIFIRRLIFIALIISLFYACRKDSAEEIEIDNRDTTENTQTNNEEPKDEGESTDPVEEGLVRVEITTNLPDGAVFAEDDLVVSSLITEKEANVNGMAQVEVFEGDGYEVSFAEDSSGNFVLLNYFNPSKTSSINLNSTTTAISLVMLQAWTAELAPSAKSEVIDYIGKMPEFTSLVEAIDTSLKTNGIPIQNESVISTLNGLIGKLSESPNGDDKTMAYFDLKEPLSMSAVENTIKFENSSSLAYGIKLNGGESKYLAGIDKRIFTLVGGTIVSWLTGTDNIQLTSVSYPNLEDGYYEVETGNGLILPSLESSDVGEEARKHNIGKIAIGVFNTFSGNVFNFFTKDECLKNIGNVMVNSNAKVLEFQSAQGPRDYMKRFIEVMELSLDSFVILAKDCADKGKLTKAGLERTLVLYNIINSTITVADNYYLLQEAFKYDSEIEFCADQNDGVFQQCKELSVTGEPSFGKVPVGLAGNASITIENRSNDLVVLGSISFPYPELYSVLPGIQNFQLEAGQKQTFLLSYDAKTINGTSLYQMSGNIVISTSLTNDGTFTLPVNGEVVNPLLLMDATQNLEVSNLNFPNSPIGTISETKSVRVVNVSDYDIIFPPAQNTEPLDGYQYSWGEQTISSSGGDFKLDFKLSPQTATDYNEELLINTGSSQVLNLKLNGTGIESLLSWEFEDGSNDFGEVEVNSSRSKNLIVTNNSNTVVDIRDVNSSDMEIFSIASQDRGFTLEPNKSRSINVSFNPKNTLVYDNRTIEIITDNAVDNLQVTVKGKGIEVLNVVGLWNFCSTSIPDVIPCSDIGENPDSTYSNGVLVNDCFNISFREDGTLYLSDVNSPTSYSVVGDSIILEWSASSDSTGPGGQTIVDKFTFTGNILGPNNIKGTMSQESHLVNEYFSCKGTFVWNMELTR